MWDEGIVGCILRETDKLKLFILVDVKIEAFFKKKYFSSVFFYIFSSLYFLFIFLAIPLFL